MGAHIFQSWRVFLMSSATVAALTLAFGLLGTHRCAIGVSVATGFVVGAWAQRRLSREGADR